MGTEGRMLEDSEDFSKRQAGLITCEMCRCRIG